MATNQHRKSLTLRLSVLATEAATCTDRAQLACVFETYSDALRQLREGYTAEVAS